MTGPQIVWLSVGVPAILGLLAITIGLVRQVMRLGRAVKDFSDEVKPTLELLQRESARAQQRQEELATKAEAIRGPEAKARR